jgi:hypothetical protein
VTKTAASIRVIECFRGSVSEYRVAIQLHPLPALILGDQALGAHPEEGDEHHHRPADADQETVRAGHVREGE